MMKALVLSLSLIFPLSVPAQSFEPLDEAIQQGAFGNLKAVIVSQYGDVVFEGYYRGAQPGDLHQVQSVTKSVGSALVGIAARKGLVQADQPLGDYFSGLYDMSSNALSNKSNITVAQVLQQRHGLQWDEDDSDYRDPANPVTQMIQSDDWYRFVLEQPMAAAPGTAFAYSSGASTLMSRVVRVATGMGPDEFAQQELFEPLGIDAVHWEIYSEQGLGNGITQWPNPDHDPSLGFSLWMPARGLLKFGELYLNGGVHEGRRILDESWVEASWTRYSHAGNSDYFYRPGWGHGYQWWIARVADPAGREWTVYFASGWGSQVIFVIPDLGAVIVTVADNYDYNGPDVDVMLISRILPELSPRLDSGYSGSWYDTATSGQGFSLEVLEKRGALVSYWYTYTPEGALRWFILQGELIDGVGEVVVYEASGGRFLQGDEVSLAEWGTARFLPVDCMHLMLEVEAPGLSTTIPLTRLTGECRQ
ncbi:MAG: beta-lactamase family protein [Gammaproteobacteria bacterium]|nr:beta-lactamase family protein [Gammaproteobacteria bacterium]